MSLQPGARLGPYEIDALLGRGGMGEVYRATDTRVARTVAVKILPVEAAAQAERRQRFEREARAVARLNHPHICTLFDVGHHQGIEFLVMEYLDGETLAARLTRGALPLDEAMRHAIALAQALARAHREGITHRDLKPSNVMITESGVKLLDFGLAKLRERSDSTVAVTAFDDQSTGEPLSQDGKLIGTLAYMSPEQLEGKAVDGRTDIYALGLILYEMLTGQRAFSKGSQAGLIASILTEEPPPIGSRRPDTPAAVERIVQTALAKQPDKRWQHAGDLARELSWAATGSHTTTEGTAVRRPFMRLRRWWIPAAAAVALVATFAARALIVDRAALVDRRSLVILPCRAGDDPVAQAYCDGLTDTLSAKLTPLALAGGTQITSTREVRQRGVHEAAQARREFGATLILEGGILHAATDLRVNYVLVDAVTLRQIDAFSATVAAGDPFALQDRVATWAAEVLALKLTAGERQTLTAGGTRAPGALEVYLQGRGYLLDFQKPGSIDLAIEALNRAITLDAQFGIAHAALGQAFWRKFEATRDAAWVRRAQASCAQAIALDPSASAPHVCQGTVALGTGQLADAQREFQQAVDREPTSDEATLGLARAQARSGAAAEAEATYKRAIALRPEYWATHVWLGTFYREQGRYADAAQRYELALKLTPDNARVYYILGGLYGSIGRYDEAIAACRKSAELVPSWDAYSNWGMTLFRLRRFGEAVAKLEQARQVGPETYRLIGNLARAYYYGGRRADARAQYTRAIALAEDALRVNPNDVDARVSLAGFYAKSGDKTNAIDNVRRLPADLADPHVLLFGAFVFIDVGDRAGAFDWLQRAARHGLAANELSEWVDLDPVKDDPRFAALPARR
jgi:eukaryotic-like serine/threonine-protein kinase